jgi:hypothetical protein
MGQEKLQLINGIIKNKKNGWFLDTIALGMTSILMYGSQTFSSTNSTEIV